MSSLVYTKFAIEKECERSSKRRQLDYLKLSSLFRRWKSRKSLITYKENHNRERLKVMLIALEQLQNRILLGITQENMQEVWLSF